MARFNVYIVQLYISTLELKPNLSWPNISGLSRTHQNNVHYALGGNEGRPTSTRKAMSLTALVHWSAQCTLSTLRTLRTLRTLGTLSTLYRVHSTVYAELDDFHTDTA